MNDLPKLIDLSPAFARRAWLRWLADREPSTGELFLAESFVTSAISEWHGSIGKPNEELSKQNVITKLEAYKSALDRAERT